MMHCVVFNTYEELAIISIITSSNSIITSSSEDWKLKSRVIKKKKLKVWNFSGLDVFGSFL